MGSAYPRDIRATKRSSIVGASTEDDGQSAGSDSTWSSPCVRVNIEEL